MTNYTDLCARLRDSLDPLAKEAAAAIRELEARVKESAMQELASLGQAQDAYEAQLAAEATVATLTAQVEAMRGALRNIDALDPEQNIDGCSMDALRGLVLRMGSIARTALTTEKTNG